MLKELQWSVKSIIVHGALCTLSRNTKSDMLCAGSYTAPDVWHSTITNTGKYYLNLIVHACFTEQSLKAAFFAVKRQDKLLNITLNIIKKAIKNEYHCRCLGKYTGQNCEGIQLK